jgi:homoserine O-acetyltransferase
VKTSLTVIAAFVTGLLAAPAVQAADHVKLKPTEGDFNVREFTFKSGQRLPVLNLHYMTLGKPQRDAAGHVTNAVLILHGTGGDGHQFERPQFADVLFAPGGLLDPARYYIILPDDIGHGKSSKPSDGMHARFPRYDYDDMVEGEYELVTEGLHVDHLRLVMGTSMGCMHSFMWAEQHPDFVDAAMPLACLPQAIAGRNRMWRQMVMEAIRQDPAWMGGDYKQEPREALRTAADLLAIAGSAPLQMQTSYPKPEDADKYLADYTARELATLDANDLLYQVNSSRDYDPSHALEQIKAPVMWINSADDFINPPELGLAEQQVKRIPHGRFVLIPISDQTHGHGTHTWAAVWQSHLKELLDASAHGRVAAADQSGR